MSSNRNIRFMDIRMQIDDEDDITLRDVVSGLRRSLHQTHRLEELDALDANDDDRASVTIRLHSVMKINDAAKWEMTSAQKKRALSLTAQCDLMDELRVPNGVKAISIALHKHWNADLQAMYGKQASPSTIKRWRIERARGWRPFSPRRHNRASMRTEIEQVRARFAAQTVCNGMSVTDGYRAAIREVDYINSRAGSAHGSLDAELAAFSYATFARDCRTVSARIGRPHRRRRTIR